MALKSERVQLQSGIEIEVLGGGSGDPIVFLHAAGGIAPADPFLEALAEHWEVVAPIHPGFNDLAELDEIRDIHDLALHYDDVLDALELDAVPVIGHSLGGMFAAELAAHVPSRVPKLVLAAPLGLWNDDYPVADLFIHFPMGVQDLVWANPDSPAAQKVAAAAAAVAGGEASDNPQLATIVRMLQGLASAGKFIWPLPDKGLSRRLRRIKASTLVLWGADDKFAPAQYAADFAAGIRDASNEVFAGAGHMVIYEKQDEVVGRLEAFLK